MERVKALLTTFGLSRKLMPVYIWKGTDRAGARKKGEIDAHNATIGRQLLVRRGINIKTFRKKPKGISEYIPILQSKVKDRDKVIFVRQFSTMIDAGLPIIQCLNILHEQQTHATFKKVIKQVKRDVEEGGTLSEAVKKHPRIFDKLFVNMITAGEAGGILDVIMDRLALYIEKMASLKKKIKSATTYPAVVISVAFIAIAVILMFVIPVFAGLFRDAGMPLPIMTVFVILVSGFIKNCFHWILLALVLFMVFLIQFRKTFRGRLVTDRILLRLPIFGILIQKVAIARFSRTLSTMLSSGVPILDSLEIVASTAGNLVVELAIRKARLSIAEGQTVAEPLKETGVFPVMVIQMITVGEATGALDTMLGKIAYFYDEEVNAAVETLTALLEPMLIVFLGVTVGFLLIAMYLPIFQLADAVSRGM